MMVRAPSLLPLAFAVVAPLGGCRTVDVASRHIGPPPQCEIHGTEMAPEIIRASSGDVVYLGDYDRYARAHFPHHGGTILSGERGFYSELESRVRDFVCPDCTRACHEYWERWRAREPGKTYP